MSTSTFATGPARRLTVPNLPTQWELLLSGMELTEADALPLLKRPGTKALRLRLWIERNCGSRYIPLRFLTPEQEEKFRW